MKEHYGPLVTGLDVVGEYDPDKIEEEFGATIIGHDTLNIKNVPGDNAVRRVLLCHSRPEFCPDCSLNPVNGGKCRRVINGIETST